MRTIKTTTTGAHAAIRLGLDFETHGALSGGWVSNGWAPSPGWMSRAVEGEMRALVAASRERGEARVYVIWSYGTPIGLMFEDGSTWDPGVRYSATTSKHQTQARYGMSLYRERMARRKGVAA